MIVISFLSHGKTRGILIKLQLLYPFTLMEKFFPKALPLPLSGSSSASTPTIINTKPVPYFLAHNRCLRLSDGHFLSPFIDDWLMDFF